MRYTVKEALGLLRTPAGRILIAEGVDYRAWPLLSRLAKWHRRTFVAKTRIIAVVGTFGKTTTTRAVALALGLPLHEKMSYNCWSGVARAILRIRPSQPAAVIEVGINDKGQMAQYARLVRPDIVIVTSIGSEHNRSLHTLEGTRSEKSEMVRLVPSSGTVILNGDDPNVLWMKSQTNARIVTFGFAESCDVRASEVRMEFPRGTRFVLHAGEEKREAFVPLLGRHMLYAVLAAVAAARVMGDSTDAALSRLESLSAVPGRLQLLSLPDDVWILSDEYKSAAETIHTALEVMADIPGRRRILVLGKVTEPQGSQGDVYREIGRRLAGVASHVIVIGRRKDFEMYFTGATRGGLPRSAIESGGDNPLHVAKLLQSRLQPGDVLLIKGRAEQHLERIVLFLQGRKVRCEKEPCAVKPNCVHCPMLERGWDEESS